MTYQDGDHFYSQHNEDERESSTRRGQRGDRVDFVDSFDDEDDNADDNAFPPNRHNNNNNSISLDYDDEFVEEDEEYEDKNSPSIGIPSKNSTSNPSNSRYGSHNGNSSTGSDVDLGDFEVENKSTRLNDSDIDDF